MSDIPVTPNLGDQEETRRDILVLSGETIAAAGTGFLLWPLIDSMNPAADTRAAASIEVNLLPIEPGQRITVKWRDKPVFVVRRTEKSIRAALADDGKPDLVDPQKDADRVQRRDWLVVVGICTHLRCVPVGQRSAQPRSDWAE